MSLIHSAIYLGSQLMHPLPHSFQAKFLSIITSEADARADDIDLFFFNTKDELGKGLLFLFFFFSF